MRCARFGDDAAAWDGRMGEYHVREMCKVAVCFGGLA